jgi:hypothetical protein
MAQPRIQIGYKIINGGLGTVRAMAMAQPIEIAHATHSTINLTLPDFQSSRIQLKPLIIKSFIIV